MDWSLNEVIIEANNCKEEKQLFGFLDRLCFKTPNPEKYEFVFLKYLEDPRPDIKAISLEALVSVIGNKEQYYEDLAKSFILMDDNAYGDLFMLQEISIRCLSEINRGNKKVELLRLLYSKFSDINYDTVLRGSCFRAILSICFNYDSFMILKINGGDLILDYDSINFTSFESEINEIKGLINVE